MNKVSLPLASSLCIVFFIVGSAFGYYIAPEYQLSMYVKDSMGLGQADRFVDLRYINAMAAHHKGAILLANQVATTSTRKEIQDLASAIQSGEPKLIDELLTWKKDWFNDARAVRDPIVANLGSADATLDLRFLNALIAHHEEGIRMTKEARTKSSRKEILDNADSVETFLTTSLVMLKGWRKDWYNVE